MSFPKHQNPTNKQEEARAPYNFVPLPDKIVSVEPKELPCQNQYQKDHLSGVIECQLITETPLYTRAALTKDEAGRMDAKDKPDFFFTDPDNPKPVIPGSSLRGMVRSLLEIVSHSKLEYISNQPLVYRAIGDTTSHGERYRERLVQFNGTAKNAKGRFSRLYTGLMQAGYLQKTKTGEWQIQPAKSINGTTFARINSRMLDNVVRNLQPVKGCKNAATIYIQPGPWDFQEVRGGFLQIKFSKVLRASFNEGKGLIEGTLARSGFIASKRSEAVIFQRDDNATPINISDELVSLYQEQISQEQKTLLGSKGALNHGQPIFYLMESGKLVFFGHTMMMRLPYHKSPQDFVPEALRDSRTLDLTEAIFGYTKESGVGKEKAYAGRVAFTDAYAESDESKWWLEDDVIIPKILASPKPTTFQHYLVQTTPDSEQVGRTRDGRPKYQKDLLDYAANTPGETLIRGHKLYRHRQGTTAESIKEAPEKLADDAKDTQHTTIKPIATGVHFRFSIHFDNLSPIELGALLWILSLPVDDGKEYRHKIGMGKPLGMGSVQLSPRLFLYERTQRYKELFDDSGWLSAQSADDDDISTYITEFEDHMLGHLSLSEKGNATSLGSTYRIRTLLKLLEWPGLSREATRYMEIERKDPKAKRGKINEYRKRPVLSGPLASQQNTASAKRRHRIEEVEEHITEDNVTPSRNTIFSTESKSTPKSGSKIAAQFAQRMRLDTAGDLTKETELAEGTSDEVALSKPVSSEDVYPGMHLEGTVTRVETNRVVVDLGVDGLHESSLVENNIFPPVRDRFDMEERFPVGKIIEVWVKGKNSKGRIQLTTRRPRK